MDFIKVHPYYPRQQQILNMYVRGPPKSKTLYVHESSTSKSENEENLFLFGKKYYDANIGFYILELNGTLKLFCYEDKHTYVKIQKEDFKLKKGLKELPPTEKRIRLIIGNIDQNLINNFDGFIVPKFEKNGRHEISLPSKDGDSLLTAPSKDGINDLVENCLVCNDYTFYIKKDLVEISKKEVEFGSSDYIEFCKKYSIQSL